MKRRGVTIGPGAPSLLLAVVVVAMSVLGLLALMSARSDAQLARRSLEYTEAEYERAAQAERSLAQLDGVLTACAGEEDYLAAPSSGGHDPGRTCGALDGIGRNGPQPVLRRGACGGRGTIALPLGGASVYGR